MATPSEVFSGSSPDGAGPSTEQLESDLLNQSKCAPIDQRQLLENCLGMPMFAVSLLEEFTRTAANRLVAFEDQFRTANLPAIADLAHALKGVAGVLAAQGLRELAVDIEAACQQEDLPRTAQLINTLRTDMQRIQQDIPVISKSLLAGSGRSQ